MSFAKKVVNTGLVVGGMLATLAIYNNVTEMMAGEVDTVLTGEERRYPWKYGDMFYTTKGERDAQPLLLVHGLLPGASSYEWRRNIDALAGQFRVYALDLLGFGLSDHPAVAYSAEMLTDLIHDFISEVIGRPAVVVARGLSSAYIIASAFRRPQLFDRLLLVSPPESILQETAPDRLYEALDAVLRSPIVGEFFYNLLTSRQALLGYYDRLGYHNPGLITDELVEYIYTCAHQPNSRYPVAALLSQHLTLDVSEPFARLQMPVVAVWGRESVLTRAGVSDFFKKANPRVDVRLLDKACDQLQDEQATAFNSLVQQFAGTTVR